MGSQNTYSGRDGGVKVGGKWVARITSWNLTTNVQTSEWGDSDSEGYTNRLAGRKDATFTTEGKFDSSSNPVYNLFAAGDVAEVILYVSTEGKGELNWRFPRALCTEFSLNVNVDTGEVVGWTANWGADGKYYRPGGTAG